MNPAELLPQVYHELRKLAAAELASEQPGQTLGASALVHEAFLKLGGRRSFATRTDDLKAAVQASNSRKNDERPMAARSQRAKISRCRSDD